MLRTRKHISSSSSSLSKLTKECKCSFSTNAFLFSSRNQNNFQKKKKDTETHNTNCNIIGEERNRVASNNKTSLALARTRRLSTTTETNLKYTSSALNYHHRDAIRIPSLSLMQLPLISLPSSRINLHRNANNTVTTPTVIRFFTSPPKKDNLSQLSNGSSSTKNNSDGSTSPPPPPSSSTTKERLNTMMENIIFGRQHIKNRPPKEKWRTSDLLSVWGVAGLFTTILFMPFAYQHMKKADHQYDDFALMPVDDIDQHIASIFVQELKEELKQKGFLNSILDDEAENKNGDEQNNSNEANDKTASTTSKSESRKLVRNTVIDLAKEILSDETLSNALSDLITKVIQSPQVQKAIQMLVKQLWFDLISDPDTKTQVVALLQSVIQDEAIKKVVKEMLVDLIQDEDVYRELMELVKGIGEEEEVQSATQALLTESTHQALNDPEILDHSMEFATDVVGDDVVQRTSGEALRNTVSYAIQPGLSIMLSILGISLVTFSFTALKNARFTEREGAALNKAISNLGSRAGNIISRFFSRLWSAPRSILTPITSAVTSVFMTPYEMVKDVASAVGHASGTMYQSIAGVFQAPIRMIESTTLATKHVFVVVGKVSGNMSGSVQMFSKSVLQNILSFSGKCKLSVSKTWRGFSSSAPILLIGTAITRVYSSGITWITLIYSYFSSPGVHPR
mmetsp:Transcript_41361/g.60497  ORF Transcript_41361/g.60497 Transcript_41361/m.60497 type:complete len:682 (+) Transcript_41361:174-2219(+)